MKLLPVAVVLGLLTLPLHAGRTNLVENLFTAGPEGWQSVDLPDGAHYYDPAPTNAVVWSDASGAYGASIAVTDMTSGTIFLSAPSNVVSQVGVLYGAFLQFDLTSTHRDWTLSDFVVIRGLFAGQPRAAIGALPSVPGTNWTSYNLRLVAGNFRWNDPNGSAIAARDFRTFLRSADALWIPAEFGVGAVETTRLRSFRIVAEEFLAAQCVPAITLDGFPGQKFRVEYLEALGAGTWLPMTNITVTNSPMVLIDSSAIDGYQRFYRAIELP